MGLLTIRGHTLLCLQGFRGEGYSPSFVENLSAIHRRLSASPDQTVQVVEKPDQVCAACPHLAPEGCGLKGPGSEAEMRRQDREVMARLEISNDEILPWGDILRKIGGRVKGEELADICGSCPWLPLGYCKEGIQGLNGLRGGRNL